MIRRFVIAGTSTNVGKTVFSAALVGALDGTYWKPVQSGTAEASDRDIVARLSGLSADRLLPEAYTLTEPLSPHRAAEIDGITIDVDRLVPPPADSPRPLIIELAGGLMVPLTRAHLQIRLLQKWELPVILVAGTALGTINHSLLSIFALRMHEVPIHGLAFVGDANEDSERTISDFGQVKRLGRLPILDPITGKSLADAFATNFNIEDFA